MVEYRLYYEHRIGREPGMGSNCLNDEAGKSQENRNSQAVAQRRLSTKRSGVGTCSDAFSRRSLPNEPIQPRYISYLKYLGRRYIMYFWLLRAGVGT